MTAIAFRPSGDFTWAAGAPCGQPDAPNMFPADNDTKGRRAAKALCDRCPVRKRCLDDALSRGESHGIWGGLDPDERRIFKATGPVI